MVFSLLIVPHANKARETGFQTKFKETDDMMIVHVSEECLSCPLVRLRHALVWGVTAWLKT